MYIINLLFKLIEDVKRYLRVLDPNQKRGDILYDRKC